MRPPPVQGELLIIFANVNRKQRTVTTALHTELDISSSPLHGCQSVVYSANPSTGSEQTSQTLLPEMRIAECYTCDDDSAREAWDQSIEMYAKIGNRKRLCDR